MERQRREVEYPREPISMGLLEDIAATTMDRQSVDGDDEQEIYFEESMKLRREPR